MLEFLDRALPGMDHEMAGRLQRLLEKQGLKFRFNTGAEKAEVKDGKVHVDLEERRARRGTEVATSVLVCRRPPTRDGRAGARGTRRRAGQEGVRHVDEHFETNVPGVYAIGDVIGGLMLAHKAEEEGIAVAEGMHGGGRT